MSHDTVSQPEGASAGPMSYLPHYSGSRIVATYIEESAKLFRKNKWDLTRSRQDNISTHLRAEAKTVRILSPLLSLINYRNDKIVGAEHLEGEQR